MGVDAIMPVPVTATALAVLCRGHIGTEVVLVGALTVLLSARALGANEASAGFANPGVLTIGALNDVFAGRRETSGVDRVARPLFGCTRSLRAAPVRFAAPVVSMFVLLDNTAIVAMLIRAVRSWAESRRIAPSNVMIPLPYAAILGGTITLIEMSTSLVVDGLLIADGKPRLGFLESAWVGVPTAVVGIAFVLLARPRLIPDRQGAAAKLEDPRQHSVEMRVAADGPLVGSPVETAGLRRLSGLSLVEIDRAGAVLLIIGPAQRLCANDRLAFVGIVDSVVELQRIRGLLPAHGQAFKLDGGRNRRVVIEALVSDASSVVSCAIRESRVRSRYEAVVLAVTSTSRTPPSGVRMTDFDTTASARACDSSVERVSDL